MRQRSEKNNFAPLHILSREPTCVCVSPGLQRVNKQG